MKNFVRSKKPVSQPHLFSKKIEEYIPSNSSIFGIKAFLDKYNWQTWISRAYVRGNLGRSVIHPKYLVGCLLFGLIENIRSTRGLERACSNRVELLYFLDGLEIDHTTFSKFRNKHKELLGELNRSIVEELVASNPESLMRIVSDGTRIRANNGLWNRLKSSAIEQLKSEVLAELELRQKTLDTAIEEENEFKAEYEAAAQSLSEENAELNKENAELNKENAELNKENAELNKENAELNKENAELNKRLRSCQISSQNTLKGLKDEHEKRIRQVRKRAERELQRTKEKLTKVKKALKKSNENDKKRASKRGKDVKPGAVPMADPDSNILLSKEGYSAPNYTPIVTVDAATGAIIHQDVAKTSEEAFIVEPSIEAARSLGGHPSEYLADTAFATGENLSFLEAEDIKAVMPTSTRLGSDNPANRPDPSQAVPEDQRKHLPKTGKRLSRACFVYSPEKDVYHCPMGEELRCTKKRKKKNDESVQKTYTCRNCSNCPLKNKCLEKQSKQKTISRDQYQDVRDRHGLMMLEQENIEKYKERCPTVEITFARIKGLQKIRNFMTRGYKRVQHEWLWICASYNMKLLVQAL